MKKGLFAALSLMLVAMLAVSCAGGSDSGGEAAPESVGRPAPGARVVEESGDLADQDMAFSAQSGTTSAGGGGGGGDVYRGGGSRREPGLPELGLSVIKTATVGLEVPDEDLQKTLQNATSTAEKYGGFVVSTSVADDQDNPTGAIVVRVPASRFSDALTDLESLGTVVSERVAGQDVSQEFIDLQARLRNYVAQETVLLRLMKRARSVTDTIRVQNELARVQLHIERLRGRITFLEDQTAMSTIEMRVSEEGAAGKAPGEFSKAWKRAKEGLVAVIAGLIASLGVVVPIGLLTLLVVFVIVRLRPRFGSQTS